MWWLVLRVWKSNFIFSFSSIRSKIWQKGFEKKYFYSKVTLFWLKNSLVQHCIFPSCVRNDGRHTGTGQLPCLVPIPGVPQPHGQGGLGQGSAALAPSGTGAAAATGAFSPGEGSAFPLRPPLLQKELSQAKQFTLGGTFVARLIYLKKWPFSPTPWRIKWCKEIRMAWQRLGLLHAGLIWYTRSIPIG